MFKVFLVVFTFLEMVVAPLLLLYSQDELVKEQQVLARERCRLAKVQHELVELQELYYSRAKDQEQMFDELIDWHHQLERQRVTLQQLRRDLIATPYVPRYGPVAPDAHEQTVE